MYLLYSLVLFCYFLVLAPTVVYRRLRHGQAFGCLGDRVGRLPSSVNPSLDRSIWIHAVSVGEVLAARPLLADLRQVYPDRRIFLSTTTQTGQQVASQLSDVLDGTFYAPLDFSPCVKASLDRVVPELMIFMDTEIWPNWLRACQSRGVKTVVVNGRISDRSYRRYLLAKTMMRRALSDLDRACVQTEEWGNRFIELGLCPDRLVVTGSLKFDALDVNSHGSKVLAGDDVLQYFRFTNGCPVLVAASTLDGEDEIVLRSFLRIQEVENSAVLILAPRHPERCRKVMSLAKRYGLNAVRRTSLSLEMSRVADVVVLDTVGELPRLFQVATVVFMGGSLVPAGGHNILEPAAFGKPIVFGPHMENFIEISNLFVRNSAAWQLQSPSDLEDALITLLKEPSRRERLGLAARALVEANTGAKHKTLEVLTSLVPVPPLK